MKQEKRVCLLTGAGGTLGNSFCTQFSSRYDIAAVYRYRPPLSVSQTKEVVDVLEPAKNLPENTYPIFSIQADLLNPVSLKHVVELTLARFGRIDVLVNNAAVYSHHNTLDPRAVEEAAKQFHINTIVPMALAQQVNHQYWRYHAQENRKMRRNIVNVSSIGGLKIYTNSTQGLYSASKAALNYLTLHMADEFSDYGVRVNALAPNSFPSIISTESVSQAIARMDEGTMNGTVLVMDKNSEQSLTADTLKEMHA